MTLSQQRKQALLADGPVVQPEPDLAAMKAAFVEAWPWLAEAMKQHTAAWHDAQWVKAQTRIPDEPFLAALLAAYHDTGDPRG